MHQPALTSANEVKPLFWFSGACTVNPPQDLRFVLLCPTHSETKERPFGPALQHVQEELCARRADCTTFLSCSLKARHDHTRRSVRCLSVLDQIKTKGHTCHQTNKVIPAQQNRSRPCKSEVTMPNEVAENKHPITRGEVCCFSTFPLPKKYTIAAQALQPAFQGWALSVV